MFASHGAEGAGRPIGAWTAAGHRHTLCTPPTAATPNRVRGSSSEAHTALEGMRLVRQNNAKTEDNGGATSPPAPYLYRVSSGGQGGGLGGREGKGVPWFAGFSMSRGTQPLGQVFRLRIIALHGLPPSVLENRTIPFWCVLLRRSDAVL